MMVEVNNLSKQFRNIKAVDDLSFQVKKGEVYGFLGQNGAGKSTTIRMLLSLIRPDSGTINIFNKDLLRQKKEVLAGIGAIIEKPDLYNYLTALENLRMAATLTGVKVSQQKLMEQLETVGIASRAGSKVKTFSQGMKQRLGLACALIHDPALIILDEPTNGLDPQGIADVRNLILHLCRNENKTIIISSHLLNEIELVADSMLIIDKGKKLAEGKVSELFDPADSVVHLLTTNDVQAKEILKNSGWAAAIEPSEPKIRLRMHRDDIPLLAKFLVEQNLGILSLYTQYSLEEYFLSLTNSEQHVATFTN
jgi:ABC-type multidrug transport system ATPase subunit